MSNENLEGKRWFIAIAAIVIQLCLGTVYAWSVFTKPLIDAHGWGGTATQVTFMILIGSIGLAAAFGGTLVDKKGPKFVATIGGILFGLGTLLAGAADQAGSLILMYIGYGFIAGVGNGMCYITPIATLVRWFPDKRGLVTGLAVMGFGAGAFFMGKIAPNMVLSMGVNKTFYIWGIIFLILIFAAAQFFRNPPQGWLPAGFTPQQVVGISAADSYTFEEAIKTPQWWMLWGMLFLNVSAGLGLISQLSPMAQDVIRKTNPDMAAAALALAGGSIVAYTSIFNGLGRLFWAWFSDAIGRKNIFIIMFITQIFLYIALPYVGSTVLFAAIACYLLSCYGGGFASMPAFATDSFGPGNIGKIYGIMLTAWGAAGIAGPLLFAQLKGISLYVAAGLLVLGLILAVSFRRPVRKAAEAAE